MTFFQTIILGVVQGATEFLPISSSGHLVIVPHLFGWELPPQEAFLFDVLVQVATLVAVFAYFWRDLVSIATALVIGIWRRRPFEDAHARMGWYLALATIPAGAVGLGVQDLLERAFSSPLAAALALLVTAGLLLLGERLGRRSRTMEAINWLDALWIGAFQVLALFPGVSRSGATITGGMNRHLDRPSAARFSFLMSVPVMLAAGLAAGLDLAQSPQLASLLPTFAAGFLTAAVVGYLSIRWLLSFLASRPLYLFALYCTLLSMVTLISLAVQGGGGL
jgi:undecaprenyl-diphosphatase